MQVTPSYIPGLITGSLALGGVLIGLLVNYFERSRDRRMALRKEVYLQAAEAMAGFQEYLAKFSEPSISQEKHQEVLKGAAAAINKIHVAGEIETIRRFEEAGQFFAEQVSKLARTRFQLSMLDSDLGELDGYIGRVKESLSGLQTIMQGLQREEPTEENVRQWHATMEVYRQGEKRLNEVSEERSRRIDERLALHLRLINESLSAATDFRKLLCKANLALRHEMRLDLPERDYMGLIDQGSQKARSSLASLIQGIQEDTHKTA